MSKLILLGFFVLGLAVFAGCASVPHKVATEEMSPDHGGKAYSDLLVVASYEDRAYRVGSETSFAEMLRSRGIAASPSYDLLPDLADLETNEEVADRLATTDHDGMLVVATLDEGYDYDMGDYYESRGWVYLLGGRPGVGTDTGAFLAWAGSGVYSLYVGLWDVETRKPVWQITTDSKTTGSESGDTTALAEFVVATMREKGLLQASGGETVPAQ